MPRQTALNSKMHLNRKVIIKRPFMLISKATAYSQGALVLEVLVQEGPSALIDDLC